MATTSKCVTIEQENIDKAKEKGLALSTFLNRLMTEHFEKGDIKEIPYELSKKMPDFQNLMQNEELREAYFADETSEVNKAFRLTLTYPQLLQLERLGPLGIGIKERIVAHASGDE